MLGTGEMFIDFRSLSQHHPERSQSGWKMIVGMPTTCTNPDSNRSAFYAIVGSGTAFDPSTVVQYKDYSEPWLHSTVLVVESQVVRCGPDRSILGIHLIQLSRVSVGAHLSLPHPDWTSCRISASVRFRTPCRERGLASGVGCLSASSQVSR